MRESACDVLIVGGGVGGCAAAMAACSLGFRVVMTEETGWIGGQLTSQAVPPDENPWIEQPFGGTARYRDFRDRVRQTYRAHTSLTAEARADPLLNPGSAWVSRLAHEPRVALAVLEGMLQEAVQAGSLRIQTYTKPVTATTDSDFVRTVEVENSQTGEHETIGARYILDATELGDLLPLADVEYVTGAESQSETGEPHAPAGPPQPDNIQGFTWCFAMGYDPNGEHTIDKPAQYERWRAFQPSFWPGPLIGWTMLKPATLEPTTPCLFPGESAGAPLFTYRRVVCRDHYPPESAPQEVTIVNWPQNDYFVGSVIDQPEAVVAERLNDARQLSLSLLYWLQTEAPRGDGGAGYPGLTLRPDITGTDDGLAMAPYYREARRLKAQFTVLEQHISPVFRPGANLAEPFADSVGIGYYRIDLHMSTGGDNYIDIPCLPFRIPLGALIPVRVRNLLPACKNLGVTHITNGCYRLHPVEWNIGEAAGLLAAFCLQRDTEPQQVRATPALLAEFQTLLTRQGIPLQWPADLDTSRL